MAQGICFYDRKHQFWTGTFIDTTHADAIKECLRLAREISAPNPLPPDGDIVAVDFVIDQQATARIAGSSSAMESFEEWLKKKN